MAAVALPFTPLGGLFHLEPPPAIFFAWLAGMVLAYLALAECAKRFFYRHLAVRHQRKRRRATPHAAFFP